MTSEKGEEKGRREAGFCLLPIVFVTHFRLNEMKLLSLVHLYRGWGGSNCLANVKFMVHT